LGLAPASGEALVPVAARTVAADQQGGTPAAGVAVTLNPRGKFLGVVPSGHAKDAPTNALVATNLTYHGGPVQHSSIVRAIFWQPAGYYLPPSYTNAVTNFFADVAKKSYTAGNVYAASTQYSDASG